MTRSDGEREALLAVMGPGEYFGELAMDEGPRSASVVTIEPCKVLVIPAADLADFVKRNPVFAMHFIRRLIGRIRTLTESVRSTHAEWTPMGLWQDCCPSNRWIKENLVETEPHGQSDIASRVGCSREMVSRIFKDLVQGGYITHQRDRICWRTAKPRPGGSIGATCCTGARDGDRRTQHDRVVVVGRELVVLWRRAHSLEA